MAHRPPHEHVDEVEPDRVVGLEQALELLCPLVAGLEVRYPVLLRHLLRHVLALEPEEDEAAQEQRQPRAEADHQRRAQLRPDRRSRPPDRLDGDGPGLGTPEGVHGLEGAEAGEGGEESGGSHGLVLVDCGGGTDWVGDYEELGGGEREEENRTGREGLDMWEMRWQQVIGGF